MSDITSQIRSMLEAFAAELTHAIRADALESVAAAVGGKLRAPHPTAAGRTKRLGRSPGRRPKGGKRDPDELAALQARLLAYVKSHPGERIEQIGKGLGVPTKDLTLGAKKLIATKLVSTKGQKRATAYWPGGGGHRGGGPKPGKTAKRKKGAGKRASQGATAKKRGKAVAARTTPAAPKPGATPTATE